MDNVNHPSHYAEHCSIECIDAIRLMLGDEGFEEYCLGNALKYIWRHKYKGGSEDLAKAEKYLEWAEKMEAFLVTRLTDKRQCLEDMLEKAIREETEK